MIDSMLVRAGVMGDSSGLGKVRSPFGKSVSCWLRACCTAAALRRTFGWTVLVGKSPRTDRRSGKVMSEDVDCGRMRSDWGTDGRMRSSGSCD